MANASSGALAASLPLLAEQAPDKPTGLYRAARILARRLEKGRKLDPSTIK